MNADASVLARAPSNIALVKYMGKLDGTANLPENSSLSMTLDRLCTWVEIERAPGTGKIQWSQELPRIPTGTEDPQFPDSLKLSVPELSAAGKNRALSHVNRVRERAADLLARFGIGCKSLSGEDWSVRSANTFPAASGIASSASSFAALTLATAAACARSASEFKSNLQRDSGLRRELAQLAREGSGSACRSFQGPFVEWRGREVVAVPSNLPPMAHFVALVSSGQKDVGSSEAHRRVKESPVWHGRVERAERRTQLLREALSAGDLGTIARVAWIEAWEMHSLFHTCPEPFTYWGPETLQLLRWLSPRFAESARETPPIVTLDAGPNLHLLVPEEVRSEWRERLREMLGPKRVLEDRQGMGAELL